MTDTEMEKTVGGKRRGGGEDRCVCLTERRSCGPVVTVLFQQVCDHRLSVNAPMRLREV